MLRKISQILGAALAIAFISQALVVAFSYARVGLLPSNDTAGGGSGDIYWSQAFGFDNATAFPVTTACMNMKVDGPATPCSLAANVGNGNFSLPFSGTTHVRKLVCIAVDSGQDFVDSDSYYDIRVYESEGSGDGAGPTFDRNQIGDALRITGTTTSGVAITVEINAPSTISDGALSIGFSAVFEGGDPTAETASSASCVLHGID